MVFGGGGFCARAFPAGCDLACVSVREQGSIKAVMGEIYGVFQGVSERQSESGDECSGRRICPTLRVYGPLSTNLASICSLMSECDILCPKRQCS